MHTSSQPYQSALEGRNGLIARAKRKGLVPRLQHAKSATPDWLIASILSLFNARSTGSPRSRARNSHRSAEANLSSFLARVTHKVLQRLKPTQKWKIPFPLRWLGTFVGSVVSKGQVRLDLLLASGEFPIPSAPVPIISSLSIVRSALPHEYRKATSSSIKH